MRAKRVVPGASIGVFGLLVLMALVVPASGATTDRSAIREKVLTMPRQSAVAKDEGDGGDADEKEAIRERGLFEVAIAASPASTVPSDGLNAAVAAASALPSTGGSWSEITKRPFLNDPVNRGANFGVGWGFVTGRMTAFTAAGGALYAGAASGGVWRTTDGGGHWTEINRGLPRLPVGALATDPRNGSVLVGTGEANNASENQYGVGAFRLGGYGTWTRVGGHELDGAGFYRIVSINGYLYAATSHGLWRRAESAPDSAAWQQVLRPDPNPNNSPYRTSFITDVISVPGSGGTKVLAADGWAGYAGAPASIQYNGFYVGTGAAGSFHRVTPNGDINPKTIGRTSFSASQGWLFAVVQDTSTDSLYGQGAFVSKSGSPVGPWTRIADSTQLANSDSALDPPNPPDLTTYFPGVQADYNQYILADPNNRAHVYLGSRRSSRRPPPAPAGTRSGRTGTTTSAATRTTTRRTTARRPRTPTSTPASSTTAGSGRATTAASGAGRCPGTRGGTGRTRTPASTRCSTTRRRSATWRRARLLGRAAGQR